MACGKNRGLVRFAMTRFAGKKGEASVQTSELGMEARQGSDSQIFFLSSWVARLNGRVPRKDLIVKNRAARDNARARPAH